MIGLRRFAAWRVLWLLAAMLCLGAFGDSFRAPQSQVSVKLYATGVDAYRAVMRPISSRWIRCPFQPTCSEYSVEAVKQHGIRKGLVLSFDRLRRCRTNVRFGTFDPVPPPVSNSW